MLKNTERYLRGLLRKVLKMSDNETFISTDEYDAEIARDEHIIDNIRKEKVLEGIKDGSKI